MQDLILKPVPLCYPFLLLDIPNSECSVDISVTDAERFEIRWCWITGSAENHHLPAAIVCLSSHLRKTVSWMIIIKGLAVVFWKIPIILTFLSCFLFLFEKKAMIEVKQTKNHIWWFHVVHFVSSNTFLQNGTEQEFFFLWKCHFCSLLEGMSKRCYQNLSVGPWIFQMFPFNLMQVNN